MALFKILRGKEEDLKKNKPTIKDGNAYFTIDEGYFYIDAGTDGDVAIEGKNRIKINEWHNVTILNCGNASTT